MGAYGSPEHLEDQKNNRTNFQNVDFKMEPKTCKRCGCQYVGYYCPACGKRGKMSIKQFVTSFTLGMIVGGLVVIVSFIVGINAMK